MENERLVSSGEGKITTFQTLAISKIVHLGLMASATAFIIEQLNIIIKNYLVRKKNPK